MPEAADQPAKPVRTWRPMILWTAGILLALGLAWFVGAVVVPVWQTRAVVAEVQTESEAIRWKGGGFYPTVTDATERLGDHERAAQRLTTYLHLPKFLAPHRRAATELLGFCGPYGVSELITVFETDEALRFSSVVALGETHDPRAARPLVAALRGKDPEARSAACGALQHKVLSPDAVGPLIEALHDRDKEVRGLAAGALMMNGAQSWESLDPLIDVALEDTDPRVRALAVALLGEGPHKRAVEKWNAALTDKNPSIRAAAAAALKKMRGEEPPK